MEGYSIHFTKLASLILKHDRKRKESRDGGRERGKVEGKKKGGKIGENLLQLKL